MTSMDSRIVPDRYAALKILRVYFETGPDEKQVIFEIIIRGRLIGRIAVSPESLGFPASGEEPSSALQPSALSIPAYIKQSLASGFSHARTPVPIWIELDRPAGLLPLIAWERVLRPELEGPLLRLPHLPLKPLMPRQSLDIAVCFSCPGAENTPTEAIESIVRSIPDDAAKTVRLHVFANQPAAEVCKKLIPALETVHLAVHSSDEDRNKPNPQPASDTSSNEIANPWLNWMLRTLSGKSLDSVHFVTDCSLMEEQGRLEFTALASLESPGTRRSNAREITTFLDLTGAWSVALISPPTNKTDAGMRMLQDQMAWLRPGPIYLYDLDADLRTVDLKAANRFVLARSRQHVPVSTELALLCDPEGVEDTRLEALTALIAGFSVGRAAAEAFLASSIGQQALESPRAALRQILGIDERHARLNRYTLSQRLNTVFESHSNTPVLIASTQRRLERSLAQLEDPLEPEAVRRSAEQALAKASESFVRSELETVGQDSLIDRIGSLFRRRE